MEELRDATGGCTANIYQFAGGSVAYFAPDAPDFREADELVGNKEETAIVTADYTTLAKTATKLNQTVTVMSL